VLELGTGGRAASPPRLTHHLEVLPRKPWRDRSLRSGSNLRPRMPQHPRGRDSLLQHAELAPEKWQQKEEIGTILRSTVLAEPSRVRHEHWSAWRARGPNDGLRQFMVRRSLDQELERALTLC